MVAEEVAASGWSDDLGSQLEDVDGPGMSALAAGAGSPMKGGGESDGDVGGCGARGRIERRVHVAKADWVLEGSVKGVEKGGMRDDSVVQHYPTLTPVGIYVAAAGV